MLILACAQLFLHHKSCQLLEAVAQIEHVFMKRKPKKSMLCCHVGLQGQEGRGIDLHASHNQMMTMWIS